MAEQERVELMRKYPLPQRPEDVSKYSFIGWALFALFAAAIIALTLYFGG